MGLKKGRREPLTLESFPVRKCETQGIERNRALGGGGRHFVLFIQRRRHLLDAKGLLN